MLYLDKKGRSHLLLRNVEEEKIMKGMEKKMNESKRRYIRTEVEVDFLKAEIEKLKN